MKNLLVTGGAGFIGSNFINFVFQHAKDIKIVNLDALTYAGSLENLTEIPGGADYHFIQGNICDRKLVETVLRDHQIDTIVHFAAESHVDRSISGPGDFIQSNIVGTFTLLDAAKTMCQDSQKNGITQIRFHHVSTDEVYGSLEANEPSFAETTPYSPRSPYSASKASSDHLARAYHHTYGLPVTISNCSNNYGPYQFPEKLIPLMIVNALNGKPLPVYGDGKQIRDWLYVVDHCEAIWRILQDGKIGETYNIGGANQPTNISIVKMICETLDQMAPASPHVPHENLVQWVKDRPGHDRRYAMDISKIQKELGWSPKHTLEDGIQQTTAWYLDHMNWLGRITGQNDYQSWVVKNYSEREKEGKK